MPIDPKKLDAWRRLAAAASSGPWLVVDDEVQFVEEGETGEPPCQSLQLICPVPGERPRFPDDCEIIVERTDELGSPRGNAPDDFAFLAAAREAVPVLVEEVERLHALLTRARIGDVCACDTAALLMGGGIIYADGRGGEDAVRDGNARPLFGWVFEVGDDTYTVANFCPFCGGSLDRRPAPNTPAAAGEA